ncbi:hypothetical protein ENBRE01_2376 [Enteropsectra breve]|nr:hypothetical protein ENBRE01_2376 [Enteropsectra breve]
MDSAAKSFYKEGMMIFFHTIVSTVPLAFFMTPLIAGSLGTLSTALLYIAGSAVSLLYQYFRIRDIASKRMPDSPPPYSELPENIPASFTEVVEEAEESSVTKSLKGFLKLFKYFNSIAAPLFYCFIALAYFQQFLALFSLSRYIFHLGISVISAGFGLLIILNLRYSYSQNIVYLASTILMAMGVIWIYLQKIFYTLPTSELTLPNDALSISPPTAVLACVYMFSSVRIPRSFLEGSSANSTFYKIFSIFAGYLISAFYVVEVHSYNIQSVAQFFLSAADHIIKRTEYFTENGELLFSTGAYIVPLTLGFLSLCPVLLLLNENLKKAKALNNTENNTEAETNSEAEIKLVNQFTRFYSKLLIFVALLSPLLMVFGTIRDILFVSLITSRFFESFISYPLSVIASFNRRYSKSFKIIPTLLLTASSAFYAYALVLKNTSYADINSTNSTMLFNDTTTLAST